MTLRSIQWNEKGQRVLTPLQRDAYERGEMPRRFEGRLYTDGSGNVWLRAGEHTKLVGEGGVPTLADGTPGAETHVERDLDASDAKPARKRAKTASKRKRK